MESRETFQSLLGAPVAMNEDGMPTADERATLFRCPGQVLGLDCDAKVFALYGEDPFVAPHDVIDLTGELLDQAMDRLQLRYTCLGVPERPHSWI